MAVRAATTENPVPCGPRIGSPRNRTDNTNMAEEIASGVSGTFTGIGDLEGVTVDYTLSPPYPSAAVDFPPECFGYDATLCEYCAIAYIPIDPENPNPVFPDDFIFMQYEISGWIEGNVP